jgi:micrococcal nuclease
LCRGFGAPRRANPDVNVIFELARYAGGVQRRGLRIAAITTALLVVGCSAHQQPHDGEGVVVEVIDGDTVDVRIGDNNERVRLIGIDTPETKKPDSPVECYGPEATAHAEGLLPVGAPIRIERDTVARDDYGRLLGYLYRLDDELFINYEILRQGFAQPLTIEPNNVHATAFREAARLAESDNLGLWAACAG